MARFSVASGRPRDLLERMGFFDRFSGKKPAVESAPAAKMETLSPGGSPVLPQLVEARQKLEAKDLPAALALYEEVLVLAGERADVLVTISADLGVNGYVKEIIELVAPRYDADRHGPATGLNVLQAYLALRNAEAAQHVLDILFALQRPELEERLHGFSNAIADFIQQDLPPLDGADGPAAVAEPAKVHLVSISKPIWFYSLEPLAAQILPSKAGKLRRVAFAQLSLPGVTDIAELTQKPEDDLGRLTRAIPLWLAETFYFSPHYLPCAAVGVFGQKHYALMAPEWTVENITQLVNTTEGGLDYVFTGALRQTGGEYELLLRVWEIKKMKERRLFTVRWNASTADAELTQLHEQVRMFMEWSPEKTGITYAPNGRPSIWLNTLGASLSLFLAGKGLLPKEQLVLPDPIVDGAAEQAALGESASLAWLVLKHAGTQQGLIGALAEVYIRPTLVVKEAQQLLAVTGVSPDRRSEYRG
ncbi:MAG: hypothetical protein DUW69_001384 [Verrucomicrobia bacterium]|nr:MAG: hypothetical protein DUW69_001384 [Verrucomicrobiota bacterium]